MSRYMNDPHVESLRYAIVHNNSVDYSSAERLVHETADFRAVIEKNVLIVTMKAHTSDEEQACLLVGPFLRAWEVRAGLDYGPDEIGFRFEGADIIDRAPSPGDKHTVYVSGLCHAHVITGATLLVHKLVYPAPPSGFKLDSLVEQMYYRYERYRKGRESLLAMAYYVLTEFEGERARKEAADRCKLAFSILDKLGELTATGCPMEARKAGGRSLTDKERLWVEGAVKLLIIRAGECAARQDDELPKIKMADLPKLD